MKLSFEHDSRIYSIDLAPERKAYRATLGKRNASVEVRESEKDRLELRIDGEPVIAHVSTDGSKTWVTVGGQTTILAKSSGSRRAPVGESAGSLAAPMPGQVRSVNVKVGEAVTKGQTLLVIEAMKMEIRIQAPRAGVVSDLPVRSGQIVEREQILITID